MNYSGLGELRGILLANAEFRIVTYSEELAFARWKPRYRLLIIRMYERGILRKKGISLKDTVCPVNDEKR